MQFVSVFRGRAFRVDLGPEFLVTSAVRARAAKYPFPLIFAAFQPVTTPRTAPSGFSGVLFRVRAVRARFRNQFFAQSVISCAPK